MRQCVCGGNCEALLGLRRALWVLLGLLLLLGFSLYQVFPCGAIVLPSLLYWSWQCTGRSQCRSSG